VVGDPDHVMPIHQRVQELVDRLEGRPVLFEALERFDFYAAARACFAVVRTSDPGPYGCFILSKGVIYQIPSGTLELRDALTAGSAISGLLLLAN
jgi:L-fucose mutarotase